jgi:hypothetical protein
VPALPSPLLLKEGRAKRKRMKERWKKEIAEKLR